MIDIAAIRERFLALSAHLDERRKRIFAATEARTAGYGGVAAVSRVTGIAVSTIGRGLAELSATDQLAPDRVRRASGGGTRLVDKDPTLLADLLAMVEPDARGDPMSPLRWTCKSLSQLASGLVAMGHKIGRSRSGICCINRNSACRPIARRAKAKAIRIAMLSSPISTRVCETHWLTASR
jgi:hypothetical protein